MANDHTRRDAVSGSGDITADWGPQGLQITDARPRPVWARITGVAGGTNRYSWVQVDEADTTLPDWGSGFGMSGTTTVGQWPAYEVTGNGAVATGTKVQIWPSPAGQFWLFYSPTGSTAFTPTFASSNSGYDPSSTTFADTGVTVTLPAAGVYLVFASTRATVQASGFGSSSSGVGIYIKLRNATAAADIAGTTRHTCYTQVLNRDAYGSALVQSPITATGATEIRLQSARYDATGLATFTVASIEEAYMWYLRLS